MSRHRIVHTSRYAFAPPAQGAQFAVRLRPRETPTQHILFYQLVTRPRCEREVALDRFGNEVTTLRWAASARYLEITSIAEVELEERALEGGVVRAVDPQSDNEHELYESAEGEEVDSAPRVLTTELAVGLFRSNEALEKDVVLLARRVGDAIVHERALSSLAPTLADVLRRGRGVCLDQARVVVAILRAAGLRARFVGGYLLDPERPAGIAATEAHAWAQVWSAKGRWLDVDPSRVGGRVASVVEVAYGVEARDIGQLTGSVDGRVEQRLEVEVLVSPL